MTEEEDGEGEEWREERGRDRIGMEGGEGKGEDRGRDRIGVEGGERKGEERGREKRRRERIRAERGKE